MATVYFNTMAVYKGVLYPAKTHIEVEDSEVEDMKNSGAYVVGEPRPKNNVDITGLVSKTVNELTRFAKANNIDLGGATKKADIFNTIVKALEYN